MQRNSLKIITKHALTVASVKYGEMKFCFLEEQDQYEKN